MNFRKLEVYKFAINVLIQATEIAKELPVGHGEIRDQLRRSSLSISLNIAEATGKTKPADQRRFYSIARGSAMETAALLDCCRALGLAKEDQLDILDRDLLSVVRMLSKMSR